MTFISNDPIFWPSIAGSYVYGYYVVASSIVVVYDLVLTFGQEFDLVWRQRWSFMAFLYAALRYSGLILCSAQILNESRDTSHTYGLLHVPLVFCTYMSTNLTDLGCTILANTITWMLIIENTMVGAIVIARLYVMYQQSRIILILLISIYSAVTIPSIVIGIIWSKTSQYEEAVLSGQYFCSVLADNPRLRSITWVLGTLWEVLALSLAVWIAIKHFRELPTGWTIEDCFTVLIQYHVLYFVAFAAVACLNIGELSPSVNSDSMEGSVYAGVVKISVMVEMFVLAPRLVLSIRQYNAKVVAESDETTAMTSIAFQERTQMSNVNDA